MQVFRGTTLLRVAMGKPEAPIQHAIASPFVVIYQVYKTWATAAEVPFRSSEKKKKKCNQQRRDSAGFHD